MYTQLLLQPFSIKGLVFGIHTINTILPFPSLSSSNLNQWGHSHPTLQLYSIQKGSAFHNLNKKFN